MKGRKRKSPRRHTVHPKHPRYNVNQYGRGVEGHSGEKLRRRILQSQLKGHDPRYYHVLENPYNPKYSFIGVKPYLSGKRTISYKWEKIVVDKKQWYNFLNYWGFKKIASAPDGTDIIYRNAEDMYVVVQRETPTSWIGEWRGLDLGYVRFDAHPKLDNELIKMVHEFRGQGKVSEMDTDYIGEHVPKSQRGMLLWSKDGEDQPSARDFEPVSLQLEGLQKDKNMIRQLSKDEATKKFHLRITNAKINALKDVRN